MNTTTERPALGRVERRGERPRDAHRGRPDRGLARPQAPACLNERRAAPPLRRRSTSAPVGRFVGSGSSSATLSAADRRRRSVRRPAARRRSAWRAAHRAPVPENGSWPVSASYSITPTLYQSEAGDATCSVGSARAPCRRACPAIVATGRVVGQQLRRDAEVEHDDAAVRRHEDVGRFDVAMHDALLVNRDEAVGELRERVSQARLVERRRGSSSAACLDSSRSNPRSSPIVDRQWPSARRVARCPARTRRSGCPCTSSIVKNQRSLLAEQLVAARRGWDGSDRRACETRA